MQPNKLVVGGPQNHPTWKHDTADNRNNPNSPGQELITGGRLL